MSFIKKKVNFKFEYHSIFSSKIDQHIKGEFIVFLEYWKEMLD